MWLVSLPRALAQWLFLFACNLVFFVLGLVLVAVGIPFRVAGTSLSDGRPIVDLPRWLFPWGNAYDGLQGDKRGRWAASTPFGWAVDSFGAMYTWAALRNPANNMRLLAPFYCPVGECAITGYGQDVVKDSPGQAGWQFVVAKRGWRRWYGFYFVHQWNDTRAFVVRLGFKITVADNGGTELIGETVKVDVWKSI